MPYRPQLWIIIAAAAVASPAAQEKPDAMSASQTAADNVRVFKEPPPPDPRISFIRNWHHGSGFSAPADRQTWLARAAHLRQQILVAAGLWPMPEKCDLRPVIHGRIERDGYTVEKVFFRSYPGFYVTGNLYRPVGRPGPLPGVLCPHGHWRDGRFYQASEKELERELKGGFEKDPAAARSPLQARCVTLARMGCVVFHYDMVGYADCHPGGFPHRDTYRDIESDLYLLSIFGLQTWNSIRALDFLLSLPEVDPSRIACTGASGGGTQTFILMAIDDRLKVAAPVCMISAGDHQGGCVCENNSLLRLFTDNVEIAACFAPRPLVHPTATGDWTARFLEEGLPQWKAIWGLFAASDSVHAVRFTAGHNYNLNSRLTVYEFFNTHLKLGQPSPISEKPFVPLSPKELTVFDEAHPRPADSVDAAGLKKQLIADITARLESLRPRDAASLERFRQVAGTALRHMTASGMPAAGSVAGSEAGGRSAQGAVTVERLVLRRKGAPEQLPVLRYVPAAPTGAVTIVVHGEGKAALLDAAGKPGELVAELLARGQTVLLPDVFAVGELAPAAPPATVPASDFFTCYNRTALANRVHDILTAIGFAADTARTVNLVGVGRAGPWCMLARSLAGGSVARTAAEAGAGIDFARVRSVQDDDHLPGALRYGGFWALAALAAPAEMMIISAPAANAASMPWMTDAWTAASARDKLTVVASATAGDIVRWLTR